MYELRAVRARVHAQGGHKSAQETIYTYGLNWFADWTLDAGIGERVRVMALDRVHFIYRTVPSYVESLESRLEKMDRLLSKVRLGIRFCSLVPYLSSASPRRRCQPAGGQNGVSCNTAL